MNQVCFIYFGVAFSNAELDLRHSDSSIHTVQPTVCFLRMRVGARWAKKAAMEVRLDQKFRQQTNGSQVLSAPLGFRSLSRLTSSILAITSSTRRET